MRSFQEMLSRFFLAWLPGTRRLSQNTITAYRDSFVLLLRWLEESEGVPPGSVSFDDVTPGRVARFAAWAGRSSPSSGNARLAAVKSFFRFVRSEEPALLDLCNRVIEVRATPAPRPRVGYVALDGLSALLAAASSSPRDLAMLSVLYDLGLRVSELCSMAPADVRLARPATAEVTGKGGRSRLLPMDAQVAAILEAYLAADGVDPLSDGPLFRNARGARIGRAGVAHVLSKRVAQARESAPEVLPEHVTPHMLRHSKAMHLLEAGVSLIYIRDILGHSSVTTTEVYARANPETKRKAIERASEGVVDEMFDKEERDDLVAWLRANVM